MKKVFLSIAVLAIIIAISACGNRKGELLTQRVQYDVNIISPEKDLEWWVQNLESNKREKLINVIMAVTKTGKQKVYDVMTYKQLTETEIKKRGTRTELLSLQREFAPYESYDSLVTRDLQLSDITRIRFLEEWYLNEESGLITKKVIAICPMLESFTEEGEFRGHLPLYWISFVKKFPLAVE